MYSADQSHRQGKRQVYNVGDFFELPQAEYLARIQQLFIIYFADKPYLFLIADRIHAVEDPERLHEQEAYEGQYFIQDHVVDCLVWKVGEQIVCGLPSLVVTPTRPWIVPAPKQGRWMRDDEDEEGEYLLKCDWELDCL